MIVTLVSSSSESAVRITISWTLRLRISLQVYCPSPPCRRIKFLKVTKLFRVDTKGRLPLTKRCLLLWVLLHRLRRIRIPERGFWKDLYFLSWKECNRTSALKFFSVLAASMQLTASYFGTFLRSCMSILWPSCLNSCLLYLPLVVSKWYAIRSRYFKKYTIHTILLLINYYKIN